METIVSAVKSTNSLDVRENIRAVCKAIAQLKASNSEAEVKAFLETVNFESAFEKLVAIKLINAFKLRDNLICAFSTEDLFVISQSLKCDWFFEDEGDLLLDKDRILTFFSKLSYSSRCKTVRKYAKALKDCNKAERLFTLLEEVYGNSTAVQLLAACSEAFITDLLYSKNIFVPPHVLKQLYQKYPDFAVDFLFSYFEKRSKNRGGRGNYSETYGCTLSKLASEKTDIFIQLYNKFGSTIYLDKFGRSVTRKILKSTSGHYSVLSNTELYLKVLNTKLIILSLTRAQLEEFHFCLLPKLLYKFTDSISYYHRDSYLEILNHMDKTFAEELLLKNFKKKYGKDPVEVKLGEDHISLFPQEVRTRWAEKKLGEIDITDSNKAIYSSFLPFNRAFEALKLLIPTALDVGARIQIIESMMKSAKMSKDVGGASQVFSYVVSRFRNDSTQVKLKPLEELRAGFNLLNLTVEQWAPVIELINIMELNNDINSCSSELIDLYEKYIHLRLISGLSIDTEMERLLKHIGYYYSFTIAPGTKYEAYCLNWFNDYLDKKDFANDREKENFALRLFITINKFNHLNPGSSVVHKDWILNLVKIKLGESYSQDDIIKSLKKHKALRSQLYDDTFPNAIFPEILHYKLCHNISDIANNVHAILQKVMASCRVYYYKSFFQKLLLYIDLPNKFIEQCIKIINSEDEDNSVRLKENGVTILSFLGNAAVFISFIENYYPAGSKADCEGTEAYEMYRIQSAIAACLKNINPPYRALEAIKKYSKGDYLKLVLGSILSVSLKVSQAKSIEFIRENLDTPVSFRKHIIRVFRLVASKTDTSTLLLASVKNEKNVSIRVILFNSIFDMIKNDQNPLSWDTVKQSFAVMNDVDLKQLERIYNLRYIPTEYLADYIEVVWTTMVRLNVSKEFKRKIFSLIDETTIVVISDDFADILLSLTYSDEKDGSTCITWNTYIALYLNYCKPEMAEKRLTKVIQLIRNTFGNCVGEELDSLKDMLPLIESICQTSLSEDVTFTPSQLLSDLHSQLLQIFPEHKILKVSLTLSLFRIFLKNNKADNVTAFADEVCSLIDLQCATYGAQLLHVFSSFIKEFVESHFHSENQNNLLIFSHRILTGPTSPFNKILAVISMPTINLELENEIKMFKTMLDSIKSSPDPALKIYARHCLYSI